MSDYKQNKAVWVALVVLIIIVILGMTTTWFLFKLFPSEIELQIKRSGITATVIGGSALFLLIIRFYFSAYMKILKIIAPVVLVGTISYLANTDMMFPLSHKDVDSPRILKNEKKDEQLQNPDPTTDIKALQEALAQADQEKREQETARSEQLRLEKQKAEDEQVRLKQAEAKVERERLAGERVREAETQAALLEAKQKILVLEKDKAKQTRLEQERVKTEQKRLAEERGKAARNKERQEASAEADMDVLSGILDRIKTAYEQQDFSSLQKMSKMPAEKVRFLSQIFQAYQAVQISITDVSLTGNTAQALITIKAVTSPTGDPAFPAFLEDERKMSRITLRKQNGSWGKVIW